MSHIYKLLKTDHTTEDIHTAEPIGADRIAALVGPRTAMAMWDDDVSVVYNVDPAPDDPENPFAPNWRRDLLLGTIQFARFMGVRVIHD